jgi:Dirigent-like protein
MSRAIAAAVLFVLLTALPVRAASDAGAKTITYRLISSTYSGETVVDRAPMNVVSAGDVIVVTSLLRNAAAQFGRAKGAVVGGDAMRFTVLTKTTADMTLEMTLPGGTIRASGRVRLGPVQTYAVRGGSGKFAHARGQGESRALTGKFGSNDRRTKVYRLRLP